jgi:hypothetical protein
MRPDDGCKTIRTGACLEGANAFKHLHNFFDSDPRVTLTLLNGCKYFLTGLLDQVAWGHPTTGPTVGRTSSATRRVRP